MEEDVETAARVEGVVNQITLRNYIERTDEELREAVRHALIRDASVDVWAHKRRGQERRSDAERAGRTHARRNTRRRTWPGGLRASRT